MREKAQRFDPRQHMHSHTFEVFHYREPRWEGVQIHHHDFYELYFLLDGDVEYWVDGSIYRLRPGDLMLINPMEFHRPLVQGSAVYERIVLWIDKEYLEGLSRPEVPLTRCFDQRLSTHTNLLHPSPMQRTAIHTLLSELVRESYGSDYGADVYARGLFLQFMTTINRLALQADTHRKAAEDSSPLVSRVLTYIGEHYSEDLSLEALAQRFYVSKYHLSHEFSRAVGISVYRYLLMKRLFIARQLLIDGLSPGDVCSRCGFKDYTAFYRAFKAEYGISPRACAAGEK